MKMKIVEVVEALEKVTGEKVTGKYIENTLSSAINLLRDIIF